MIVKTERETLKINDGSNSIWNNRVYKKQIKKGGWTLFITNVSYID